MWQFYETLRPRRLWWAIVNIRFLQRLRFSLRTLLLVTALAAIATFWWIARPTIIANRFVAAVMNNDYETARSLLHAKNIRKLERGPVDQGHVDRVYAEVLPREWEDVLGSKRRVILRYTYHEDKDGSHVEWTTDCDLVADAYSVEDNQTWFHIEVVAP